MNTNILGTGLFAIFVAPAVFAPILVQGRDYNVEVKVGNWTRATISRYSIVTRNSLLNETANHRLQVSEERGKEGLNLSTE